MSGRPNLRSALFGLLAAALAAATTKARSLRRRLKAPAADEDDFQQAILLDLIHRADRFDPDRAVPRVVRVHGDRRLLAGQRRLEAAVGV